MTQKQQPALIAFAVGMIGLGILALVYGDFAMVPDLSTAFQQAALEYINDRRTLVDLLAGLQKTQHGAGSSPGTSPPSPRPTRPRAGGRRRRPAVA